MRHPRLWVTDRWAGDFFDDKIANMTISRANLLFRGRRGNQMGWSLMEVLVAVFVLGTGIVGALGMQLGALRTARQSAYLSTATELASDITDRMRADHRANGTNGTDNPFVGLDYDAANAPSAPGATCHGPDATCTPDQMVRFDIYEWEQRLRAALPGARAVICRDTVLWNVAAGGYDWNCSASAPGTAPVVVKIGWRGAQDVSGSDRQTGASRPVIALVVADA